MILPHFTNYRRGPELDHSSSSEVECQREIRRGVATVKERQERQKGLVTTRRNTLAESKVLKKHHYLVGKDVKKKCGAIIL
jgi:hypothetical protein